MSESRSAPQATVPPTARELPGAAWAVVLALVAAAVLWELVPYRLTARFPLETPSGPHPAVFRAEFGYITHTGMGFHFGLARRCFYGRLELEPTGDGPSSTYEIFAPDLAFWKGAVRGGFRKSFSDSVVSSIYGRLSQDIRSRTFGSPFGDRGTTVASSVGPPWLELVFYGRLPNGNEQPIGRVDGRLSRLAIGR